MKKFLALLLAAAMLLSLATFAVAEEEVLVANKTKVRTIITTDGEDDDQCSLIRYLLYANEFELEGIVSSSSKFHYDEQGPGRFKGKDSNQSIIDLYAEVYPMLSQHGEGYPTPEYLTERNFEGNISLPGEMDTDTEGSLFIKSIIMDDREDRLLIQVRGGANTVAAALRSIEEEYKDTDQWEEVYNKVCKKIVLDNDLDQDDTITGYIMEHWESVPVVMSSMQYIALAYAHDRTHFIPAEYEDQYYSAEFMEKYIWGRGPFAEKYKEICEGRGYTAMMGEGDTPMFFYGLDVGLRSYEDPTYGGWGGRFMPATGNGPKGYNTAGSPWSDTSKLLGFYTAALDNGDVHWPLARWIPAFQNDFAARINWTIKPYEECNHEPVVQIEEGLDFNADKGETVTLTVKTYDPDGDDVAVKFWQYDDADTIFVPVEMTVDGNTATITVPENALYNDTIHIIVEATDNDEIPLTRYQRAIITVTAPATEETTAQ
ncbi:MAG: nucleoside hydrolase-like domain-containing protein [Aristaeellaceae bacterium]